MKHFIVTLLVGFWLLGPHAFADVNAKNGISITTASTINGKTPNSAFNGLTIVSGGGGAALIASVQAGGSANTVTTGAIDTTGANIIVINAAWYNGVNPVGVMSDSKGNTYTELTRQNSTLVGNSLWYCYNPTVGTGHTFTYAASNIYPSLQVLSFSGVASTPLDQQNGAISNSPWTTLSTGSITPSQANTVVVAGLGFEANSSGTISINSGFSTPVTTPQSAGNNDGGSIAYKILTSATATNPQWTSSSSSSEGVAVIASFKY